MKRAAMVIVVVAVATARAGAGDYQNPQTNNSGGFYMAPRLSDLRQFAANTASPYSPVSYAPATRTSYSQPATTSYVQAGPSCGTRSCGSCGQCGSCGKGHCDDRTCCQKLKDFLCWRPSPGCECCKQPTEYTPPLTAFFQCREGCNHFGQCGSCGRARVHGCQQCSSCTTCGATTSGSAMGTRTIGRQSNSLGTTVTWSNVGSTASPTVSAYSAINRKSDYSPANPVAGLPYQFSKPMNSTSAKPAGAVNQTVEPAGYRVQPSAYYLPRD